MTRMLILVLMCSISAAAQDVQPARVHFYRTANRMLGVLLSPSVYFDRDKVAKLPNGSTFDVSVRPGSYAIRVDDEQLFAEHVVDFQPGKEYFVRVTLVAKTGHVIAGGGGHLQIDVVPEDEALSQMRNLKMVPEKKVSPPTTGPLPQ